MRRNVALSVCRLIYLPFALEFFVSLRLLPSLPTLASLLSRLFTFNSFNCTCLPVCSCRCFCCYSYCCWKLQLTLDGRRLLPLSSLAKLPPSLPVLLSISHSLSLFHILQSALPFSAEWSKNRRLPYWNAVSPILKWRQRFENLNKICEFVCL